MCAFSKADHWTETVATEVGANQTGRTYTQLHLLSDQRYRLSFLAQVQTGYVRVAVEAAEQKTELLVLPKTATLQAYSAMFQTPPHDRNSVLVTVEFATETEPARFRLADVAIEHIPSE